MPPDIVIDESPAETPKISAAPTSVAAFIGATKKGVVNRPVPITSFAEFERQFGPLGVDLMTGYAVAQFFANGGREANVVRIAKGASFAKILAALHALDAVEFNLLVLPGIAAPPVLAAAEEYCRARRALLIIDPPESAGTPAEMLTLVQSGKIPRSPNAALYFPWTKVPDPLNHGHPRSLAPGGTIAGLLARTDAARGVWKSPAGPDAGLIGVKSLTFQLNDEDSAALNAAGINSLRTFPTFGIVAWGARTLDGAVELASEWKYLAVRRLGLLIEESVTRGIQWAVFEPNDEALWSRLRAAIGDFLLGLFRDGALQGATPRAAFFVKCGADTTTPGDLENGIVNIQLGFAPLRPAEFVVLRIQQHTRRGLDNASDGG